VQGSNLPEGGDQRLTSGYVRVQDAGEISQWIERALVRCDPKGRLVNSFKPLEVPKGLDSGVMRDDCLINATGWVRPICSVSGLKPQVPPTGSGY